MPLEDKGAACRNKHDNTTCECGPRRPPPHGEMRPLQGRQAVTHTLTHSHTHTHTHTHTYTPTHTPRQAENGSKLRTKQPCQHPEAQQAPRAAREKRAEVGGDEASAGWGLWAQGLQATWHDHQILKSRENHRSPSNHRQPTSKPRKVECRTRGRGQSIRDCQSACLQRSQRKGHKCKQEKYERGRGEGLGFRGGFKQSRALDRHSHSGGGGGGWVRGQPRIGHFLHSQTKQWPCVHQPPSVCLVFKG